MKIMKITLMTSIITGIGIVAHAALPPLSRVIDPGYADDPFWNDGKAEVATYDAKRVIYGKLRDHEVKLLTVTEDFTKEYFTKADWPYGQKPILPVVKQNRFEVIETQKYPYHFMTSTFAERENFSDLVKMTISSQEWCGITTKEYQLWKDPSRQVYLSYWEGEGEGDRILDPPAQTYFEEELTLILRGLRFEDGLGAQFYLYDNQITNKAPQPSYAVANLRVTDSEDSWLVEVRTEDGRRIEYRFDGEYPHALESMDHSDGRTMTLRSLEREAYWK